MKWIKNFITKICEWSIIMSKTTLISLDLIDDLKSMNKSFNDKINDPISKENKLKA